MDHKKHLKALAVSLSIIFILFNSSSTEAQWDTVRVDGASGNVGMYTSIVLDSNNNPHISYYDNTNGDLKYAYYDGQWHSETIDSSGDVGLSNSLALDGSGNPHISYQDLTNGEIKYAYYKSVGKERKKKDYYY